MKMKASLILPMAALILGLSVAATGPMGNAYAQEAEVYGRELMTEQEQDEFQARMRSATSSEERDQIRWEHHRKMQERAQERGLVLPNDPMFGMRQRPGQGHGEGPLRLPKSGGRRGG